MKLKEVQHLELPPAADMHVHLRQDELMKLVAPHVRAGGVDTVFVMPNLQPPVTTVARALEYRAQLQASEPNVQYLMSLYLHSSITPEVIAEAAAAGIAGVKLYPQGVTTNSESGVSNIADFHSIFAAMEEHDLVLNLHGEVPYPSPDCSLEEAFLPTLEDIHKRFPKLRIVLEHCSTAAALDAVRRCGPTVAGTITAHHLYLTGDMSHEDPLAFCKPIPKTESDMHALLKVAASGDSKFFFGSDSAPHLLKSKKAGPQVPAGVFTQPYATQLVLLAFEEAITKGIIGEEDVNQERLEAFLSRSGRSFYKLPQSSDNQKIILERKGEKIPQSITSADGALEVGLSRATAPVFSLRWSTT